MQGKPLIRLDAVTKIYRQQGSGKTTLLNLIGALDTPDSGEIHVGDKSLGRLRSRELSELRLRSIGFVFQDFNLMPVLTALENGWCWPTNPPATSIPRPAEPCST